MPLMQVRKRPSHLLVPIFRGGIFFDVSCDNSRRNQVKELFRFDCFGLSTNQAILFGAERSIDFKVAQWPSHDCPATTRPLWG
jgi:hypothetical protein